MYSPIPRGYWHPQQCVEASAHSGCNGAAIGIANMTLSPK
jgi:hypothetical protein